MKEVTLQPYASIDVRLALTALCTTVLAIPHVSFLFHRFFPCTQSLHRSGKRLHATKAQRIAPSYADPTILTIDVGARRPQMSAELADIPTDLLAGEEVQGMLQLVNVGKVAVEEIQLFMSRLGTLRRADSCSDYYPRV